MDEDQLIAAAMAAMERKIVRLTPQAPGMDPDLRAFRKWATSEVLV